MNSGGKKIMIVADNKSIRMMLQCLFMANGYAVETTHCPDEALDILGRVRFGAIILDLMRPKANGVALCAALEGKELNKQTPIIILTAGGEKEDWERLLSGDAHTYIEKPFISAELIGMVSKAMESERIRI